MDRGHSPQSADHSSHLPLQQHPQAVIDEGLRRRASFGMEAVGRRPEILQHVHDVQNVNRAPREPEVDLVDQGLFSVGDADDGFLVLRVALNHLGRRADHRQQTTVVLFALWNAGHLRPHSLIHRPGTIPALLATADLVQHVIRVATERVDAVHRHGKCRLQRS